MKPTFDSLLKCGCVLLILPVAWAWLQPEKSAPWLFMGCQLLLLAFNLGRLLYRYGSSPWPAPGGPGEEAIVEK